MNIQANPEVGDYLVPDGWAGLGGLLMPGDAYVDESYPGAPFRVQNGLPNPASSPVALKVTGRVINWNKFSAPAVRCRIEWIQDGEPSDSSYGWVVLHSYLRRV